MQFIDLAAQQAPIREKIEARIKTVLNHGRYIMGPEVYEFEENDILASENEQQRIRYEMRKQIVRQILTQIQNARMVPADR